MITDRRTVGVPFYDLVLAPDLVLPFGCVLVIFCLTKRPCRDFPLYFFQASEANSKLIVSFDGFTT